MTRPTSRDDILGRKRDRLAHDPALVDTRRRVALDYLSARAQNSRAQLGGDSTQRYCQRSLAMSLKLDRFDSLAQVPAAGCTSNHSRQVMTICSALPVPFARLPKPEP